MFRIIYDSLRTCNFNFFIAFSCFSCDRTISPGIGICGKEENTRLSCHTTAVTSSCCSFLDLPLFNFKTVGFLNSVGQFFLFALVVPQLYVSCSNSIFIRFVELKKLSKEIWCHFPQKFSVSCTTTYSPSRRSCCQISFFLLTLAKFLCLLLFYARQEM